MQRPWLKMYFWSCFTCFISQDIFSSKKCFRFDYWTFENPLLFIFSHIIPQGSIQYTHDPQVYTSFSTVRTYSIKDVRPQQVLLFKYNLRRNTMHDTLHREPVVNLTWSRFGRATRSARSLSRGSLNTITTAERRAINKDLSDSKHLVLSSRQTALWLCLSLFKASVFFQGCKHLYAVNN